MKIGDVVKLKSGSPPMTITMVVATGYEIGIHCVWFDKENRCQEGRFNPEQLEIIDGLVTAEGYRALPKYDAETIERCAQVIKNIPIPMLDSDREAIAAAIRAMKEES